VQQQEDRAEAEDELDRENGGGGQDAGDQPFRPGRRTAPPHAPPPHGAAGDGGIAGMVAPGGPTGRPAQSMSWMRTPLGSVTRKARSPQVLDGERHGDGHALGLQPGQLGVQVLDREGQDQAAGVLVAPVVGQRGQPPAEDSSGRPLAAAAGRRSGGELGPLPGSPVGGRGLDRPSGPGQMAKYEHELSAFSGLGLDDVTVDD
jgi:hypothetical protein